LTHKRARSLNKEEVKFKVDLGAEVGKPDNPKQMFLVTVRPTTTIRMESLKAYLIGKGSWTESVLECMSESSLNYRDWCQLVTTFSDFLDHLLRQGPSERFKLIKRSFFSLNAQTYKLNDYTEAVRGIYSAIRMTEVCPLRVDRTFPADHFLVNQFRWSRTRHQR